MLSQAVQDYLAMRRRLGFKLVDTAELLQSFASFAAKHGDIVLRSETAVAWARQGASVQRQYRRLRTIGLFAEHLRAEDLCHESIPTHRFNSAPPLRHPPRIFSLEEIEKLLAKTAELRPLGSIRSITHRTLIGLLFTTGMRISEALKLRIEDVNASGITIRETKFCKSRWLPLHPSTIEALDAYLVARHALTADNDWLFLSQRKQPFAKDRVLKTFQALCAEAGITGAGARRKPRLHDYADLRVVPTTVQRPLREEVSGLLRSA